MAGTTLMDGPSSDPVFAALGMQQFNQVRMDPAGLRTAIASAPALPTWDHWAACGEVMPSSVLSSPYAPMPLSRMQILPDCLPPPSSPSEASVSALNVFKENVIESGLEKHAKEEKKEAGQVRAELRELTNTSGQKEDETPKAKCAAKALRADAQVFVPTGSVINDSGALSMAQEHPMAPAPDQILACLGLLDEAAIGRELLPQPLSPTVVAAPSITVVSSSPTSSCDDPDLTPRADGSIPVSPLNYDAGLADVGPAELLLRRMSREMLLQCRPAVSSPRGQGLHTIKLTTGQRQEWSPSNRRPKPADSTSEMSNKILALLRPTGDADNNEGLDDPEAAPGVGGRRRRRRPNKKENESSSTLTSKRNPSWQ